MPFNRATPRALYAPNPLRIVANRGAIPTNTTTAGANSLRVETRMFFTFGNADLSEIRLVWHGFTVPATNVETPVGNAQGLRAWLEYAGKSVQLTFGGSGSGSIPSGTAEYVSDPLKPFQFGLAKFPRNMTAFVREERSVANGQIYGRFAAISYMNGEYTVFSDGTSAAQGPGTGALTVPSNGSGTYRSYGPSFIVGRAIGSPDIAVIAIGDSLTQGNSDVLVPGGSDGSAGGGFVARALLSVGNRCVPHVNMAVASTGVAQFLGSCVGRQTVFKYGTHCFEGYGTNDFGGLGRTTAQVQADKQALWGLIKGGDSTVTRIEAMPIFPRCNTSSDTWATAANMTPNGGYATGGPFRDVINSFLAGQVGGGFLDAVVPLLPAVQDTTGLDRWLTNGTAGTSNTVGSTTDGTHPSVPVVVGAAGGGFGPGLAPLLAARVATWV